MKRTAVALTALAAAGISLWAGPTAASAHGNGAAHGSVDKASLAAVRQATAKYHNVDVAIADGYIPTEVCASEPGVGGMGYHYVNLANLFDGVIDPVRPEILVYVPSPDGPRLGAVEYLQPDADQDVTTDGDRPSVLGVPFDGPMPGHEPGQPVHYDKHIWLWKHNPAGMLASWNPAVTCP
jgi:hypothetical protein